MTPPNPFHADSATGAWYAALQQAVDGRELAPRGMLVLEAYAPGVHLIDPRFPLVTCPPRGLSQRFACAEALWIIDGQRDVESLAKFAPRMREFSDDGITLAGAYGPRIDDQRLFVLNKLLGDRDTRQATLTIWQPNPTPSKDLPCTVALTFQIREDRLQLVAYMRSSDVWLGLPYDIFSFAMLTRYFTHLHNLLVTPNKYVLPGRVTVLTASSHAYLNDKLGIMNCLGYAAAAGHSDGWALADDEPWSVVRRRLEACRDTGRPLYASDPLDLEVPHALK